MKITKIMDTAYQFASVVIDGEPYEKFRINCPQAKERWNNSFEKPFVENLIAGALFAYHEQLCAEMAEKDIILPDLEP